MKVVDSSKIMKIVVAFLALILAVSLTSCGSDQPQDKVAQPNAQTFRTLDAIKQSGTVKVGIFTDKSPFGYLDADGKNVGYDIDYGNALATALGVKVEYVPVDAAARVSALESGKVDIILANFTVTPERKEKVDYSYPYMKVSLGLASRENSPVASLDEIGDKKLTIVTGTTAETYLKKNHPDILAKAQKFEQYTDATQALATGVADLWLTDNTEALAFVKNTKGFVVAPGAASIGSADLIAPAVAKGNSTVLAAIDADVKEKTANGFFKTAYETTLAPVYGAEFESSLLISPEELQRP